MIIGVIGAGIAGLTAARKLALAGHEVTIFEKSNGLGGRMATRYAGEQLDIKTDHGAPCFTARSEEFRQFVDELLKNGIADVWADHFPYFTGEMILEKHPDIPVEPHYFAPGGMNKIGKYLSRWVDVRFNAKVNGFTYLGDKAHKKRNWMINFSDFSVMEVDAVIVATPAPQAYGLIENAQDETPFKWIIRNIDTISYQPCYTLMVNLGNQPAPEWKAIQCNHKSLRWIGNEATKRRNNGNTVIVVQSSAAFASAYINSNVSEVTRSLLMAVKEITGLDASKPVWSQLHFWKYRNPRNVMPGYFVEPVEHAAPAALIGDYFGEADGVESAYLSGLKLAEQWLDKYPVIKEPVTI
ncbi:MAG: FAD-dependent oxidoreductase [Rhodothermaceae bacterium]|nr:FAD-dependent oxidoreductase [Rhodothermaceae bacterium]